MVTTLLATRGGGLEVAAVRGQPFMTTPPLVAGEVGDGTLE